MSMGRKVEDVVVPQWGLRDDGNTYRITEMPAAAAEKWAYRLFIVLKGTTGQVPDDVARLGMVGVAIRGLNVILEADIEFEKFEALLDEMMTCVQIVRDINTPDPTTGMPLATKLLPDDIQEVQTRAWLRSEVLRVHTGFSFAGALSTLLQATRALADMPTTETSRPPSGS
jgi:hypothetical protein